MAKSVTGFGLMTRNYSVRFPFLFFPMSLAFHKKKKEERKQDNAIIFNSRGMLLILAPEKIGHPVCFCSLLKG